MTSIRQTVPAYAAGMSEQPDHLKFPGQLTDITNAIPDVTKGLFKRPGAKRVGDTKLANVQSNGSWFHYFRDENEGAYLGQVDPSGNVRIWKASGNNAGAEQNVVYGTGGETACEAYLATSNPENLQFLTINDTTFVSNRDNTNPLTAIRDSFEATYSRTGNTVTINYGFHELTPGYALDIVFEDDANNNSATDGQYLAVTTPNSNAANGTITVTDTANSPNITSANCTVTPLTPARPEPHFAFVDLLRTENGRQYGLNIYNSNTTTPLSRATKIEISANTYDESDGTGHCPGIGTGVFSVSAASSYTGTTTNYVHDANGHGPQIHTFQPSDINVSNEEITITNHGLTTGEQVVYTKGSGTNDAAPSGLTSGNTYYAVALDANTISLSDSYANATIQPPNAPIVRNLQDQGTGTHTLDCKGVGLITSDRDNLTFRFSALGQQGVSPNYSAAQEGPGGQNYRAAYSLEVTLLHGGEGWQVGDVVNVSPTFAAEAANVQSNSGSQATVSIKVLEIETTNVKATVSSSADGLIRPAPTPFDADTAITADTILGGLTTGLPSGITAKVIGTGIYYSSDNPFNVEIVEEDLMRVMQSSVNDVSRLPNQCRNGYIVKVANARLAEEDDYYLRFDGQNGRDGSGSWNECAAPDIPRRLFNMPLAIQRTGLSNPGNANTEVATFTVGRFPYQDRLVGDNITNPYPSFVTAKGAQTSNQLLDAARINKVIFFRNRLAFLSGENVILSRPGTFGVPDFFIESALTVGAADPIDISASSMFPSEIFDALEINSGLVVFSSNQQFLLSTDSEILNPETAKLRSISVFNYNINLPPISLGTTVAFVDNSGKFSRFNEMANVAREGEPDVVEQSKVVPSLIPKDVDLLTNSRENSLVLIGKTNSDTVYGFKYFNVADRREQQAWFKWKFNRPLKYHFIINDDYYLLDQDNFLQQVSLTDPDTSTNALYEDDSITQDGVVYNLHLDNYTNLVGGVYDQAIDMTVFTNKSAWLPDVGSANGALVVVDTQDGNTRVGRFEEPIRFGAGAANLTLNGDWSQATNDGNALKIGYLYEYKAQFPRIYPTKVEGEKSFADVNSSVVVHRVKIHFGKIGLYETTLTRKGKPNYTEVYESALLDEYDASEAPYLAEYIKTVPIYERNTNVGITLKSSHPAPATLRGLSWEGDFTPRFYKRV